MSAIATGALILTIPLAISTSSKKWTIKTLAKGIVFYPLIYLFIWGIQPPQTPLIMVTAFFALLGFNGIVELFLSEELESSSVSSPPLIMTGLGFGVLILIAIIVAIGSSLMVQDLYQLTNFQIVENASQLPEANISHLRLVPYETAKWKSDKVVGELGYKCKVGEPDIHKYKGRLVWLTPLEHIGLWQWNKFKYTEGYVIVDAEDPDKEATLVTGHKLRYIPSGYFRNDLHRHVYKKYPYLYIGQPVFHIDNEDMPKFVVPLIRPGYWFKGTETELVLVVDPESGEIEEYRDLDELPSWIDRAIDEKLAEKYTMWFGKWVYGLINTLFSHRDMKRPTGELSRSVDPDTGKIITRAGEVGDVFFVDAGNNTWWYTMMTSWGGDESTTGYVMMDTRTGKAFYYKAPGYFNDLAAAKNAENRVSQYVGYGSSQPIFYKIYGVETWVIPILDQENKVQMIGIVQANTGLAVADTTIEKALALYRQELGMEEPTGPEKPVERTLQELIRQLKELFSNATRLFDELENELDKLTTNTTAS